MKIIDLLNKMAKGEEVPKKIKYKSTIYTYNERVGNYYNDYGPYKRIEKLKEEK